MVTSVHDFGDVNKTDDRCTTTKYARDTGKWPIALMSEVDTVPTGARGPRGNYLTSKHHDLVRRARAGQRTGLLARHHQLPLYGRRSTE
jgi:hypothetical protein